jgi:hypothetical protein
VVTNADLGPAIFVDEINWWPLLFSLKCRQIVRSDASLVGPSADRIKLCSTRKPDSRVPGRFISYDWIEAPEAHALMAHKSRGALVNRKLKNGILDRGFTDAILALGPLRTYLLDGIRQLILKSVAISSDGSGRGSAVPGIEQEYVVVSHSLGSYLIFSALDINPATPKTPTVQRAGDAYEQVLGRTFLVYFFANQLRLLELAHLDGNSNQDMASHLEEWGRLRCKYLKSRQGSNQTCERPQIVALNDPSDLLTWTVPELETVEVHNVIVKNATHWFWLIRLDARAVFANFQCVHAHLLTFAMLLQLKAVDEKCAQHQLNLLPCRAFGNSGRDVVFLAVEPRRPGDLAGLAVPCYRNETAERDVFCVEAVGRVGDLVVVVGPHFVLAGPDRRNFKRRCTRLGLRECDGTQRDKKNCGEPQKHASYDMRSHAVIAN